MANSKDEGNKLFKKQKYSQAVKCYQQYVKFNQPDNSKAYNNMALCYFKMNKFVECIKACQFSLQLDPQFQKPYYRMYEAYRQLKDYYNVLLVGTKFIKYSKQQKQIKQIQRQLLVCKEKISYNIIPAIKQNQIDKPINQIMALIQDKNQNYVQSKQTQSCIQDKWKIIQDQIKKNPKKGINLAWKFISQQCSNKILKKKYRKILAQSKKFNTHVQQDEININYAKQSNKQSSSSSEGFQYLSVSKQQFEPLIQNQQDKQQQTQQQKIKLLNNPKQISEQQNKKQIKSQQQIKHENTQEQQNDQVGFSQEQIGVFFLQKIKKKIKNSNDQFSCFYICICQIIQQQKLTKSQKKTLLIKISQQLSRFKIYTKSLDKQQVENLRLISKLNKVLQLIQQKYFIKK